MATVAHWVDDGDWELINDDGFVYKRKKLCGPDQTITTSVSAPSPQDPALEEWNGRQLKKYALLKLKQKYQKEILRWEHLSNTSSEMQGNVPVSDQQMAQDRSTIVSSSVLKTDSTVSPCRILVDGLLSQAEAQEAIIHDVSNLCDIVEALCSAKEDRFKESFSELPVWGPPHTIISSLCDE